VLVWLWLGAELDVDELERLALRGLDVVRCEMALGLADAQLVAQSVPSSAMRSERLYPPRRTRTTVA
jgi:hypothetical protein